MKCSILVLLFLSPVAQAAILDLNPFRSIADSFRVIKGVSALVPISLSLLIEKNKRIHELLRTLAESKAQLSLQDSDPETELLAILNAEKIAETKEPYRPDSRQESIPSSLKLLQAGGEDKKPAAEGGNPIFLITSPTKFDIWERIMMNESARQYRHVAAIPRNGTQLKAPPDTFNYVAGILITPTELRCYLEQLCTGQLQSNSTLKQTLFYLELSFFLQANCELFLQHLMRSFAQHIPECLSRCHSAEKIKIYLKQAAFADPHTLLRGAPFIPESVSYSDPIQRIRICGNSSRFECEHSAQPCRVYSSLFHPNVQKISWNEEGVVVQRKGLFLSDTTQYPINTSQVPPFFAETPRWLIFAFPGDLAPEMIEADTAKTPSLRLEQPVLGSIVSVAASYHGTIATGNPGYVNFWIRSGLLLRNQDEQPVQLIPKSHLESQEIHFMAFNRRGTRLIIGTTNNAYVQIFDVSDLNGEFKLLEEFQAHEGRITDIQSSRKRENLFATASTDKTVKLWNLNETGSSVLVFNLRRHSGAVRSIAFWADELCSAGDDGNVYTWNITESP